MNPVIFSLSIDTATINVMRRSMSGVLMTGAIRLRSRMRWKLSCPVLEAGRREPSLLPSYHVRYIEKHRIPDHEGPVYLISILENYSRAVLASKVSPTQNQWDYLEVLFAAFATAGIPKAIVSDGGGIFYANQAMSVYQALGIKKERIDPKQAWQNYIETMFNIVRRMADFHFHQATSWEEIQRLHRKWVQDYNSQRHWAHESRDDGCHSPAQVIGWHKGTMIPEETLNRILFATRYTRHLDRNGYIRFQDWRLYGERGLAHQQVNVWVYEGTLKLEHQAVTLSKYRVELHEDRRHIRDVSNPRVAETVFRSPQLTLFDLGPDEWLLYWKAPSYAPRRRRPPGLKMTQLVLFEVPVQEKAAGAETAQAFLRLISSPKYEAPD